MIVSIKHKGLLKFYETSDGSKLPFEYLKKINRIFDMLDAVSTTEDILSLGNGIHKLTGDLAGYWALKVTPNFRIIFRLQNGDVYDIDFIDYH